MDENAGANYYASKLSAEKLRECYTIASPRVRQYLEAEIGFTLAQLKATDAVLELGCGYGRVTFALAKAAGRVVGVDTSPDNVKLARSLAGTDSNCEFLEMDASALTFSDAEFDLVACVQNGIRAFGADPVLLLREALRVTRPGGQVLFSTYAAEFWPHRLKWFEAQARAGLIGELDYDATGGGTIACTDGLRLGLVTPDELRNLGSAVELEPQITKVDGSSVFALWRVPMLSN